MVKNFSSLDPENSVTTKGHKETRYLEDEAHEEARNSLESKYVVPGTGKERDLQQYKNHGYET